MVCHLLPFAKVYRAVFGISVCRKNKNVIEFDLQSIVSKSEETVPSFLKHNPPHPSLLSFLQIKFTFCGGGCTCF